MASTSSHRGWQALLSSFVFVCTVAGAKPEKWGVYPPQILMFAVITVTALYFLTKDSHPKTQLVIYSIAALSNRGLVSLFSTLSQGRDLDEWTEDIGRRVFEDTGETLQNAVNWLASYELIRWLGIALYNMLVVVMFIAVLYSVIQVLVGIGVAISIVSSEEGGGGCLGCLVVVLSLVAGGIIIRWWLG